MASMTTTCPGCGTAFHVQPAQLQARQGLVRCGRCARVFNAFESLATREAELHELPPAEAPPTPEGATPQLDDELPAVFRRTVHGPAAQPHETPDAADVPAVSEAGATDVPEPVAEPMPAVAGAVVHESAAEAANRVVGTSSVDVAPAQTAPKPPSAGASPPPPRPRITIALPEPEYLEPEPSRLRWVWGVLSLLLLGLLAGQATYQFRSDIAVLHPPARPWLEKFCRALDCSVPLPRRPDYLDIAGSDLRAAEREPTRIAFEVTVRNRAPYPQEHPALELTLTDARDRPVARRVFLPAEYLPGAAGSRDPAQGIGGRGEVTVSLDLDIGDIKATGYRVYLFYP